MNDEIILIDKPVDWTSFDVVAKLRGKLRAEYAAKGVKPTKKQLRVGHAGTLDPFATGLLIILYGESCKRAGDFLKLDKVYEATIHLGATSTTGDPEGEITERIDVTVPTVEEVQSALVKYTGIITQTPPQFSAIKIGGVRAYKLAREGKSVEIPSRDVTIHSIDMLGYEYPMLRIKTHVSSGTYIRTLAEGIGEALDVGAYCSALLRTKIGEYSIEDAQGIESQAS